MRSGTSNTKLHAAARVLVVVSVLAACSDSHGGSGLKPKDSTETGNPPVIDLASVALVVQRDEVHVTGEPGAVTPAGIEVEVETLASGDTKRGPVARDGSFDVTVEGTLDDTYVLRAVGKQRGAISDPVYLYRGGASIGSGDGGVFTCEQRAAIIQGQFAELETSIDRSCTSNADCGLLAARGTCPAWPCGVVVSRDATAEVMSAADAIGDNLCDSFAADDCFQGMPQADCAVPGPIACVEGQCVNCVEQICPSTSCAVCETPSVQWGTAGDALQNSFVLTDCATLAHTNPAGSCSTQLACVGSHMTDPPNWSAADVQNALGDPDVKAALAAGTAFGLVTPGLFGFMLTVGDESFGISDVACDSQGNTSGCTEPPEGVVALRTLLDAIAAQIACTPAAPHDPACDMPFDHGTGGDTIIVYAFDAKLGSCLSQAYTGVGGNDNRFDTLESCRAACPNAFTESSCPPNRKFIADACLQCGMLPGGCDVSAPACAKLCTTDDDCAGEIGSCGAEGYCMLQGCI